MEPSISQSDVDDILRKKRKIREHKACYPCRQRKVRCDSQVPCKTCCERNHPELCAFNPPEKRQSLDASSAAAAAAAAAAATTTSIASIVKAPRSAPTPVNSPSFSVSIAREDWDRLSAKLSSVERTLADLKDDLRHVVGGTHAASDSASTPTDGLSPRFKKDDDMPGSGPRAVRSMEINQRSNLSGENVHLGGGSIPALIMALGRREPSRPAVQEVVSHSVLALFGMENETATYPFVSLWGGPQGAANRAAELARTLPGDTECLSFFRHYRDGAFITYPAIVEIDRFESDLVRFLMQRSTYVTAGQIGTSPSFIYDMSIQWIGLLFASLASGVQFSTLPKRERELASQIYVCCSFECLRLINWLSNPSLEVIQTLLVLGHVLQNTMNAGVSWALMGTTIRLAQGLGIHRASDIENPSATDMARAKTWWAVLWQDSTLSLSYDRAPTAAIVDCAFPVDPKPDKTGFTYPECMYRLCKIALDVVRNRITNQSIESRLDRCTGLRRQIEEMQTAAADHLRDFRKSTSIIEQSEYWALYLHASFMLSELCRPAMSPTMAEEYDQSRALRRLCIEHLLNTVEAFLGLINVSPVYLRHWGAVHRVLSAALLLGILGESARNPRASELLTRLVALLSEASAGIDPTEMSAPIGRAISALRKLNAPESRTPRQVDEAAGAAPSGFVPPTSTSALSVSSLADANGFATAPAASARNGVDGLTPFAFDSAAFYVPSPLSGFEDESSPYALMDSIIWGGPAAVPGAEMKSPSA